jgi:hypothetical protein
LRFYWIDGSLALLIYALAPSLNGSGAFVV